MRKAWLQKTFKYLTIRNMGTDTRIMIVSQLWPKLQARLAILFKNLVTLVGKYLFSIDFFIKCPGPKNVSLKQELCCISQLELKLYGNIVIFGNTVAVNPSNLMFFNVNHSIPQPQKHKYSHKNHVHGIKILIMERKKMAKISPIQ